MCAGTVSVSFHVALRSGSSKQGSTRRASIGSSCVTAYQWPWSSWRKRPIGALPVHRAGEAQRKLHLARRQHFREREADHVVAAGDEGCGDEIGIDRRRARLGHFQSLGIEPHEVRGLEDPQPDVDRAGERILGGIHAQVRLVVERLDVARQAQAGNGGRARLGKRGRRERDGDEHGRAQQAKEDDQGFAAKKRAGRGRPGDGRRQFYPAMAVIDSPDRW